MDDIHEEPRPYAVESEEALTIVKCLSLPFLHALFDLDAVWKSARIMKAGAILTTKWLRRKRCSCRAMRLVVSLLACGGVTTFAAAQSEDLYTQDVDLEYAEEINLTCAGCHGEFGQGSADGVYPRIGGLDANYLAKQLRDFKSRKRLNIPMLPYATERELPEEDLQAIAVYLSKIELPTKLPPIDEEKFDALARLNMGKKVVNIPRYQGNVSRGEAFYQKECANCHGRDGYGKPAKTIPRLAGQYSRYVKRQIELIGKQKRFHDEEGDADVFRQFSDADVEALLAYLSLLDDDLPGE